MTVNRLRWVVIGGVVVCYRLVGLLAVDSITICPNCLSGMLAIDSITTRSSDPCPCMTDYRLGLRLLILGVGVLVALGIWFATRQLDPTNNDGVEQ
jgi:hypothetical protein